MRKIFLLCCLTYSSFFTHALSAQSKKDLEAALENLSLGYGGVIGVAAKDLRTGETVLVHADSLFPTASVIKLPILVELFYQFHESKLSPELQIKLEDSVKVPGSGVLQFLQAGEMLQLVDMATLMIILSDNTATNLVIDQLGGTHDEKLDAVNNRMRTLGLTHTKLLNKLYSWKTKKKTAEALRFGIGVSSPMDMIILLEKLAGGEIIDESTSHQIVSILKNQQDIAMSQRFLPFNRDSTLTVANKTGSLDAVKNDVGIVSGANIKYVYAIFCDQSKDLGEQLDNRATLAVAKVSELLFNYFKGKDN